MIYRPRLFLPNLRNKFAIADAGCDLRPRFGFGDPPNDFSAGVAS
jgi:hypothetical protein